MPMVSVGFIEGWFEEALSESDICSLDEAD